jgi:hypothetical protein
MIDVKGTGVLDVGTRKRREPSTAGHAASRSTEPHWIKGFEDEDFVAGVDAVAVVV